MDAIFQKVIANNFSDLKGLIADATIPVPEYLVNEMLQATLDGNKTIAYCQISIYRENRASAKLKTTLLPWALHLNLKLDQSVDFASFGSPKIRAWLENNRLLGSLGSFLNLLPEGIKLYGNQVVVDLGAFLETPEQRRLFNFIKSADIRTEEGKVIVDVKIKVD